MRVSFNSFPDSLVGQLGKLVTQQSKLQTQVSTGQRVTLAEDDPQAMSAILGAQNEARSVSQYKTNVSRQQELATTSYSAVKSLKTLSDRASEIATLTSGLTKSDDLTSYAKEIDQMISQAVQQANGKDRDSYLFGGTSGSQPFVAITDASGKVTDVTYNGNDSVNQVAIGDGITFSAQVVGESSGAGVQRGLITDTTSGADFFRHLISLRDHLESNDKVSIANSDRASLQTDNDNFVFHIGLNGAVQTRLETAASFLKDRTNALNQIASDEGGADTADTVVRLNQAQTAYQAALQSSNKLLSLSLMDYIR
jgi:flagellar hook-associated protein 3 FlgL